MDCIGEALPYHNIATSTKTKKLIPEWLKIFSNAQRMDAKRNVKLVCPVVMSAVDFVTLMT